MPPESQEQHNQRQAKTVALDMMMDRLNWNRVNHKIVLFWVLSTTFTLQSGAKALDH
jgi:hypothetical protein